MCDKSFWPRDARHLMLLVKDTMGDTESSGALWINLADFTRKVN